MQSATEEKAYASRWDEESKSWTSEGVAPVTVLKVGTAVLITDEMGERHVGLVTAVHGPECINAVWVSSDPAKRDPYGNQLERMSSLQKRSAFTAPGGRFYEHFE